ncbi:sigma-70 family RNA polymerase sigma factor [Sphingobacterium faecale]|uniref:Sigma-70 family RNA polymerase sigma factor n=1 Tax=Sphingobacterium faecale TaxID=2803775 RepID=A0ABS1R2C4_9SPHI|nr:sigma-70 family RNA polymerase sigma factor [Sphingobacterium faecale]MBL1408041.1 sigma-70 family RNA polymerase sigma factor [Sphingobacterium faecale]
MMSSATGRVDAGIRDFQMIFDTYHDRLVFFSLQMLADVEKAQDVVQEAFVRYWTSKDTISKDLPAIKNYLYSTVRNLSLNQIRHERVVANFADMQTGGEPLARCTMEAIITAEMLSEIHTAINALPEKYRTLSWLAFVEGKNNIEIAEELGLSINTLKKQKQKATSLLKLKLRPDILALVLSLYNL